MAFRARGNSAAVRRAREGLIDFRNSHYKYVLHALAEVARHASYVAARHTPLYSGAAALGWSLSLWPEEPTRESGSYELNYEEGLEGNYPALNAAIWAKSQTDTRDIKEQLVTLYWKKPEMGNPTVYLNNDAMYQDMWMNGSADFGGASLRDVNLHYFTAEDILNHVGRISQGIVDQVSVTGSYTGGQF